MASLLVPGVILGSIVMIAARIKMDQLIRLEYMHARGQWIKDKMPRGYLWAPPEIRGFHQTILSSYARENLSYWVFKTPAWMMDYPEALRNLKQLRMYSAITILIWLVVITALFQLFGLNK